MPVTSEYQLWDFAPIGAGLVAAVAASVSSPAQPVQVVGNFPTRTTDTPIVRCSFVSGAVRSNSHIVVPGIQSKKQPRNCYDFTFTAQIETQREQNGQLHNEIVAKTRTALVLYKLEQTPAEWWPYHTIIDILELTSSQLTTDDEGTTDSTTLNFAGCFSIDPGAWPVPTPDPMPVPESVELPAISTPSDPPSIGDTLTCSTGSWTNSPTSYSYQWYNVGSPISGETNSTYVLRGADIGVAVTCKVIATNTGGNSDPAETAAISNTKGKFTVSGAGDATLNGDYTWRGTYLGEDYYNLEGQPDSTSQFVVYKDSNWLMRNATDEVYHTSFPTQNPWGTEWVLTGVDGDPAPTVDLFSPP